MKPTYIRRIRRKPTASKDNPVFRKEGQKENTFFGEAAQETFFHPAPVIQQKSEKGEEEEKKVQRIADKKEEEEKKVQRMEEKKEEEKQVNRKEGTTQAPAASTGAYLNSLSDKGQALPPQAQQFFGSRMGFDFSHVKIHTGTEASQSAEEINAQAYTYQNHIVFKEGKYNSESAEGKNLLAHELTHVIQQHHTKGAIQKKGGGSTFTPTNDQLIEIAAVVGAEAWFGQEKDIGWVYYNLVMRHKNTTDGLKESHAYRVKSDNFKINMYLLGNTIYGSDKPTGKDFKDKATFKEVIDTNEWYENKAKPRMERIKKMLEDMFKNQKGNTGFNSNANLTDVNSKAGWATELRQYLFLQDSGEATEGYAKRIGEGKSWQVVYRSDKIRAYFKDNPDKLPSSVPLYKLN